MHGTFAFCAIPSERQGRRSPHTSADCQIDRRYDQKWKDPNDQGAQRPRARVDEPGELDTAALEFLDRRFHSQFHCIGSSVSGMPGTRLVEIARPGSSLFEFALPVIALRSQMAQELLLHRC